MKRKFWIGASFSALFVAAMAPWSATQANGVSIRVNTPEFGFRIGGPVYGPPAYGPPVYQPAPVYYPAPVYQPAPVYYPAPVYRPRYYAPPPVVYVPTPRYYGPPRYVGGYRGHGPRYWEQRQWQGNRHPQQHDRNWQAGYGGR